MNPFFLNLPSSWRCEKLKYVADFRVSNVDKLTNAIEEPVRLCNYTDVYHREFIFPELPLMEATATLAEIQRFHLKPGDVVITKDSESWDDIAVPALIEKSAPDLVCGYHLAMIRGRPNVMDGRFLFRCFQSDKIRYQLEIEAKGVTRYGLPNSAIGETFLPIPPLPTQRRIAAYLDRETAQIDALVAQKELLLALLEEKRASLISHAVTRGLPGVASAKTGLNPKAKLKPSGIPWLGDVPEHWEVKELRHIAAKGTKITYGIVQAGPDIPDGIPYIRTSDMSGDFLPEEGYQKTSAEIDQSYARSRVYEGDMVISIRASVGKTLSVPKYLNGANLTQGTAKVSPGERIASRFLFHWMNSHPVQRYLGSISKGTTFKEITLEMLRRTPILVPPDEEQERIALSCDRSLEVFRSLNNDIQTSIHLLREKRASLISAAVTGEMAVV